MPRRDPPPPKERYYKGSVVPAGSTWRCPCGYEGAFGSVISHRRGFHLRPACDQGEIYQISPPIDGASTDSPFPNPPEPVGGSDAPAVTPAPTPRPPAYEFIPQIQSETVDAEEVARFLNAQREGRIPSGQRAPKVSDDAGDEPFDPFAELPPDDGGEPPTSNGNGGGNGDDLPPGDWQIVEQPGPPQVSYDSIPVKVPISLLVYYDWAKSHGWRQGSGGFDAFIADFVTSHFRKCLGQRILVVNESEVTSAGGT